MPKSGEHKVGNIDSFFRQRPSINNVREGELITFLEDGKLIKQEKRNGVVYQSEFSEAIPRLSTEEVEAGVIREIIAGDGLTGGGIGGEITLNVGAGTHITVNSNDIAVNTSTLFASPTFTGTAQGANLTLTGDLTVGGTTTTLNAQNLQVKDKNIVLNYLDGDASSTADGAGITIQDAVNSTTDATILWDNSSPTNSPGEFDFSHSINVTGNISLSGTVDGRDIATDGSKLDGIEALADKTDTANVTAAGALMDSEVDADIKTLSLPASTTISSFAKTYLDDGDTTTFQSTIFGTTDVALGGQEKPRVVTLDYKTDSVTAIGSGDNFIIIDASDNYDLKVANFPTVIGTTGTINANEFARFTNSTTLEALTAAETVTALGLDDVPTVSSGSNDRIATFTGTSALQGEANLTFNSSNVLYVNGSVGIGATSPSASLEISKAGGEYLDLDISGISSGTSKLRFLDGGTAKFELRHFAGSALLDANLSVYDHNTSSEALTVQVGGNVGIGVTNPSRKLQVAGAIELSTADNTLDTNNFTLRRDSSGGGNLDVPGNMTINLDANNNETTAQFEICHDGGSTPVFKVQENGYTTAKRYYLEDTGAVIYRNSNDLELITYSGYDINLMPSGNVGIGISSPDELLDVNGVGKVRGGSSEGLVLELGQLSYNAAVPAIKVSYWDDTSGGSSGLTSGDHLEFYNPRYGFRHTWARGGAGGAVPVATLQNNQSNGVFELFKALNPTTDATYQANVKLNVNGDSFFRGGSVTIGDVSPLTTGGTPRLSLRGAGFNIGNGTNNMSYIRSIVAGEYQWQTWNGANDGELQLQPYGGKVGIGNTTPAALLDVGGDADEFALIGRARVGYNSHSDWASFQHRDSATNLGFALLQNSSGRTILNAKGGQQLQFRVNNADGTQMIFDGSQLGIGNVTPQAPLHIGTGNTSRHIKVSDSRAMFGYNGADAIVQGGNTKGIEFHTNTDTFAGSAKMVIEAGGNVGINDVSPGHKLDVNGNINTTGAYYMDDSEIIDTNKRLKNLTSAVGTDRNGGTHIVNFATPATPGSTGWYTICRADSANARGGGIINLSVTGGSLTPTTLTIDFFIDWIGNLVRCNTQGHSGQFTKVRVIETAVTTELQIYVNTTVAQDVYISFEQDRYNPNYTLLSTWATATPTVTGDEVSLNGVNFYSSNAANNDLTTSHNIKMAATRKLYLDGGTHTYIDEVASDQLRLVSGGTEVLKAYPGGTIDMYGSNIDRNIEIGANRTGNANSYIDFIGDTTYTDYGLRIIRWGYQGVNAQSAMYHRGTGDMLYVNQESAPHIWYIGGGEKMRIDTSGRLLIGDNSANYSGTDLQVGNTSDSQNGIQIQTSTTGNGYVLFGDGTGASAYRGQVRYDHSSDRLSLTAGYTETLHVKDGNVGIGVTNPLATLDLGNATGQRMYVYSNGSAVRAGFGVDLSGSSRELSIFHSSSNASDGNISFGHRLESNGSYAEKMRITGAGNVGIGTTSPGGKLDVRGSASSNNLILGASMHTVGGGHLSNYQTLLFKNTYNETGYAAIRHLANSHNDSASQLRFLTSNTSGTMNNQMTVDDTGRIGIGTTSPALSYANKGLEIQTTDEQVSLRLERTGTSPSVFEMSARSSDILIYNVGTARAMRFGMAGTEYMRFATNGRFIVGSNYTTNASTQLVVSSSGANGLLLNNDNGNTANSGRLFFEGTSTSAIFQEGNDLSFRTGATTGSSSGTERMLINSSGNVGINSSSPSFQLKVNVTQGSYTSWETIAGFQAKRSADTEYEAGIMINSLGDALGGQISSNWYWSNNTGTRGNTGRSAGIFGISNSTTTNSEFYWQTTPHNSNTVTTRMELDGATSTLHVDGDVVAYSTTVSDKRLKDNVETIDNALGKVMKLRGVEFYWNATSRKGQHDIGLIAQEVEEVIPEIVREKEFKVGEFTDNKQTFKTVDYDKMVGVLIEAIKEQQQQINELKEKLNG